MERKIYVERQKERYTQKDRKKDIRRKIERKIYVERQK